RRWRLTPGQRLSQPVPAVDVGIVETALVTHEMPLRLRVLARAQAVDNVLVVIDRDAAAGAATGAHALLLLEEADPLRIEEVLVAQGADGAQIDDVAGELVVARLAGENVDLRVVAAVDDLQLGRAADLAGKTDAARAHDAAVGEQGDVLADVRL